MSCSLSVCEQTGCLGNTGHVRNRTLGFLERYLCYCKFVCMHVCVFTSVIFSRKNYLLLAITAMFCKHQHNYPNFCECYWLYKNKITRPTYTDTCMYYHHSQSVVVLYGSRLAKQCASSLLVYLVVKAISFFLLTTQVIIHPVVTATSSAASTAMNAPGIT